MQKYLVLHLYCTAEILFHIHIWHFHAFLNGCESNHSWMFVVTPLKCIVYDVLCHMRPVDKLWCTQVITHLSDAYGCVWSSSEMSPPLIFSWVLRDWDGTYGRSEINYVRSINLVTFKGHFTLWGHKWNDCSSLHLYFSYNNKMSFQQQILTPG